MRITFTLLTLATVGLLAAASKLRAADAVPPTPPANSPPAGAPEATAKRERGPDGAHGDRLEMMKEKLVALREDTSLSREQKGEKMREILKSSREEIKPILTPEQIAKWKAEMEKRREGDGNGLRRKGNK